MWDMKWKATNEHTKQTNSQTQTTCEEDKEGKRGQTRGEEGDQPLGGEHTMQHTGDVLHNFTLEIYIMLLTNVTPINLMENNGAIASSS